MYLLFPTTETPISLFSKYAYLRGAATGQVRKTAMETSEKDKVRGSTQRKFQHVLVSRLAIGISSYICCLTLSAPRWRHSSFRDPYPRERKLRWRTLEVCSDNWSTARTNARDATRRHLVNRTRSPAYSQRHWPRICDDALGTGCVLHVAETLKQGLPFISHSLCLCNMPQMWYKAFDVERACVRFFFRIGLSSWIASKSPWKRDRAKTPWRDSQPAKFDDKA